MPHRNKSSPRVAQENSETASLDAALSILSDYIAKSKPPAIPPELQSNEALKKLIKQLTEVRTALAGLSQGDLGTPIALRGYVGGLLKALQGNVRHMLWMIHQVAEGTLTHRIDSMGDFSKSFNIMAQALQEARDALERQKELYAKQSEELKVEVEAKIKVQEALKNELAYQQQLASTDALTGVSNRRYIMKLAELELVRCRRNNSPLCMSMMDIDHFKTINDTLGHQVGDQVLRHLAAAIMQNSRSYDAIGRYGGDEFIILFPSTKLEDALIALERLRASILEGDYASCEDAKYTISIGLTVVYPHQHDISVEDLIKKADDALYQAKDEGRNRIFVLDK